MQQEIWKQVPHKPGIKVSNLGRYWLEPRRCEMPNGGIRQTITAPRLGIKTRASSRARHAYYAVYTKLYGNLKVHRLVCETFHGPPPFRRAVVIHINENSLDNRACNLRWGTQKENLNAPGYIAYCRSRTGNKSAWAKHKRKSTIASSTTKKGCRCLGSGCADAATDGQPAQLAEPLPARVAQRT